MTRYEKLFKINIEHKYFTSGQFTGYKIFPTDESLSLMRKYGLVLKMQQDGVFIAFDNFFEGINRDRLSLLNKNISLQFSFQIDHSSFYEYTGNLPGNAAKTIFWFSNFDNEQQVWRSDLLHRWEYVSESEMIPSTDPFKYFGHIEIQFNTHLKEDMYIRFLNRFTYWRYMLMGAYLQNFKNLAIIDKANLELFSGPTIMKLPGGKQCIAFTSEEPIALTQQNDEHFRLVVSYDETTKHFERELISKLPGPSLLNATFIDGNIISEIFIA